jgi:O-6-methylguanine DNA methyltransferase
MPDASADVVYWTPFTTPLGTAYAASTRRGLCRLTLPEETEAHFTVWLHDHFAPDQIRPHPRPNLDVIEQMDEYWKGARTRFELRLDLRGTPFQRAVWDRLLHIPFGQTATYSELAEAAGAPQGYQAAGAAVGQNPVRLVVPCHRVLSADGGLTGFASGVRSKQWLLRHEGALLL